MVLEVVKSVYINRLPDVRASCIPMATTVPQLAVACGKVTSASDVTTPAEAVETLKVWRA
jgi:hypothetical protein